MEINSNILWIMLILIGYIILFVILIDNNSRLQSIEKQTYFSGINPDIKKQPLIWKEAKDMRDFKCGCIVSSVANPSRAYLVTANDQDRATAIDSVYITNPCEWLILKEDE